VTTITGNLTVNGTTTTINSTTLNVDDKLIELGAVTTPTDTTADGGGIFLFGATNKTILWDDANDNWTTSENWNLATGKTLKINNVNIASGTGAALVLGANASTSLALGNTSGTTTLNGTLSVNNPNRTMTHLMGYTSTATANGTTTLTNTSSYYQQFTGTSNQAVTLPVTSTLATGWTFHIVNNSTGSITVQSSGLNAVITVIPGTTAMVTCIGTTLTTAADWEAGLTDFSTYTGTGNNVMATSPTITTPVIDTINTSLTTSGTAALWNTGITTGTISIAGALTTGTLNIATGSVGAKTIGIGTSTGATTLNGTVNIPNTFQLAGTSVTTTGTRLNYLTSATGTTGTASTNIVFSTSPTITTPTIDTINTSLTTSGTVGLWNTGLTTGTISIGGALTTGAINIGSGTAGAKAITIGTSTGTVTINGTANIGKALLQTVTTSAGASTLTFSGISQAYKSLEILYTVGTPNTAAGTVSIQFSGDTATNYGYAFQSQSGGSATTTTAPTYANGFDQTSILVPMNHPSNSAIGHITIQNYNSTAGAKIGTFNGGYDYLGDGFTNGTFHWKNRTTAVTSITLTFGGTVTGQVVTGQLFGIN